LRGDLGLPRAEEPQPSEEQGNAPRPQEKDAAGQQNEAGQQQDAPAAQQKDAAAEQKQAEEAAAQQSEAEYLARVGDIQSNAVETFLDSHNKLLRYDALGADDVEKMQANEAALRGLITQVDDLDPPQGYEEQHGVFRSAINELYEAVRVAYDVVANPTTATKSDFDEYDRHTREGASGLQRSNELLGRDYRTVEGVQEVSPL
jgi:hypothetical protein